MKFILIFVCVLLSYNVDAWDNDELEIFDTVELINENFYKILAISQDASSMDIRKAFRALSIVVHPDKNSAEDADVQFRNLVSVYETLKDAKKRAIYDKVLLNGLPRWHSSAYWARKARKVGLLEMFILLFVLITIGQYFVSWAIYFEKRFTMEQFFESKAKKIKKSKINVDLDTIMSELPLPSIKNTLPFQIPYWMYSMIMGTPGAIKESINLVADIRKKELEKKQKELEDEELSKKLEDERLREKEERKEGLRRRKEQRAKFHEKTEEELAGYAALSKGKGPRQDKVKAPLNGGLWTDDDLSELVRLTKKYPGATAERWETIAEAMNRNVAEVTFMAYKMKDNFFKTPSETEKMLENINKEVSKKLKTKKETDPGNEKIWSQEQQKALEAAIQKYPKQGAEDRWQKIANSVNGKTKEECQARYKYLVDLVKKQKNSIKPDENPEEVVEELKPEESEEEVLNVKTNGGKKRNKRKENKKNIDYSNLDDSENDSE